MCTKFIKTNAP